MSVLSFHDITSKSYILLSELGSLPSVTDVTGDCLFTRTRRGFPAVRRVAVCVATWGTAQGQTTAGPWSYLRGV